MLFSEVDSLETHIYGLLEYNGICLKGTQLYICLSPAIEC